MRLRSKRFFMRAAARLPFLHENKLFSLFLVFRERQRDPGADIQGAVERERRAVQGRAVLDDRQTETGAAAWTAAEQEVFGETQEKIDALKADNAALDESIAAVEKEVETKLADEDTAYYNSVYEEMQKGVDQVEEYLKGN